MRLVKGFTRGVSLYLFCVALLVQSVNGFAAAQPLVAVPHHLSKDIDFELLAASPLWHKLIHYKKNNRLLAKKSVKSAITTDQFFLSSTGMLDPDAELKATFNGLFAVPESSTDGANDAHAQCRFPARYLWLSSALPEVMAAAPEVICDGFQAWSAARQIESISLFFATGYLGNPASYYGHILMRFNDGANKPADLLATSLDYGAIIEPKDGALLYIVKGLFGGYSAGFTHDQFYKQNHNYGEAQLRDLWEYRLDLDESQRDLIVAHSWELLRNKFVYYFLRNNCAYAMSELVELVVEEPLFERRIPWVAPHTVFRRASEISRLGKPLVAEITLHDSLQTRLYHRYGSLPLSQRQFIHSYIVANKSHGGYQEGLFTDAFYQALPASSKASVLDALLSYYQYRIVDVPDEPVFKRCKQAVLIERLQLPIQTALTIANADGYNNNRITTKLQEAKAPHYGQPPITLRSAVVYNSRFDEGLNIRFRPAYFDTLSSDVGRPANSTLAMANVELAIFEDFVKLKRFDVIDLEAMNTSVTGLPGDGNYLWKLNIGVREQHLGCKNCLTTGIEGGLGKSYRLGAVGEYFAAVDGRLQTSYQGAGALAITPRLGFVFSEKKYGKMAISLAYRNFVKNDSLDNWVFKYEYRMGDGRDWDIRLKYELDREEQFGLALSRYW